MMTALVSQNMQLFGFIIINICVLTDGILLYAYYTVIEKDGRDLKPL